MIFLKKYFKSIVWIVIILIISLSKIKTNEEINSLDLPLDKIAHFFMYFILTILILWDTNFKKSKNKKSKILITLLFINLYGIFIEVLQLKLTTYRSAEFLDFIANFSGSLIAAISFYINYFYNIYSKILKFRLSRNSHL